MATANATYIEITSITKTSNSQNTSGMSVALKVAAKIASDKFHKKPY